MSETPLNFDRVAIAALAVLLVALVVVAATLPALPVDETRYLTVAWEMRATGNWSLPTLNFEPYSHKPPLLFWLINASWSLFGLSVWPARVVGALAMIAVLLLTHRLDRSLTPDPYRDASSGPAPSALILLGLPLFVVLGFSIMFDMLLTATVVGAMLALWTCGRAGGRAPWIGYGAAIGLGLLAKGPIVLVFTLPAALLARTWIDPAQQQGWFARLGLSLALGVAVALAWALRAAQLGGDEYAEMLFWTQSAGRVTSSFAHARPFWFYVPILLLMLTPLLLWRPIRAGLQAGFGARQSARNFLLCWILPAFAVLSLISGKQLHYLLPVLPAVALLISLGLKDVAPRSSDRLAMMAFVGAIFLGLAVFASGAAVWLAEEDDLARIASQLNLVPLGLTALPIVAVIAISGGTVRRALTGFAVANLIFLASLGVQARGTIAQLFDLQPVADAVSRHGPGPVAVAQKTRGELGFLARLRRPVTQVPEEALSCWLVANPDGRAVVRSREDDATVMTRIPNSVVLFEKDYRMSEEISVIAAAPARAPSSPCGASALLGDTQPPIRSD